MDGACPVDVFLDRVQETGVLGELAQVRLRVVVEITIVLELARFAAAAIATWARVGARVGPLWFEGARLGRRRSRLQYALGDAAYTQDERRTNELRAELSDCLARRDDCARRSRAAVGRARARTKAERRAIAVTRVREPQG